MDCSICLDKIKCLDLVRLLDCGHYFHNICFLRNSESDRCPMCRHLILDTVSYCISNENFNFFELDRYMFNEQIKCIKETGDIIEKREFYDNITVSNEKIEKQQRAINKLFKDNLNSFKFKILKASKDGAVYVDIYTAKYGEIYEDYQVIFLLKGRRGEENYFHDHGIISIIDKIYNYFDVCSVFVNSDNLTRENYIRVYL